MLINIFLTKMVCFLIVEWENINIEEKLIISYIQTQNMTLQDYIVLLILVIAIMQSKGDI